MNKSSARRSGHSLPLPPGAVPVGTLPHPNSRHSAIQKIYDPKNRESRNSSKDGISNDSNLLKPKGSGSAYSNKTPIIPIRGTPIPLSFLPPPSTWPMFSAVPAINGRIMARNHNGSGKWCFT